jgi:hypothetical protein
MPTKVINTLTPNDQSFAVNFDIISYKTEVSQPILNIWTDLQVKIKQEEKVNSYLFLYHTVKVSDTLESISEQYYDTVRYWWLLLVVNDADEPFDFLQNKMAEEEPLKIIKQQYLSNIIVNNNSIDLSKYLGITNDK